MNELNFFFRNGVKMYDKFQVMEFYRSGDPDKRSAAIQAVCEMMEKYVYYEIDKKFKSFSRERDDLYQSSMLRIIEDMKDFDPYKGDFIPWFRHSVHNACVKFLSQKYNHSTPYYANKAKKVKEAIDHFEKNNLSWSVSDLVQHTKMNRKHVDDALLMIERNERQGSLEYEDGTQEALKEKGTISLEEDVFNRLTVEALNRALDKLDPLDRELVLLRNASEDSKKRAYKEIALRYGMKVRDLQDRLKRLIHFLEYDHELREFVKGESYVPNFNRININYWQENILPNDWDDLSW